MIRWIRNYFKQRKLATLRDAALMAHARGDSENFDRFYAEYQMLKRGAS